MVHPKTADKVRFYHKPTCSKSREAKQILDDSGVEYEEIRYMETPPSYDELKLIAKVLEGDVHEMMRDEDARKEGWEGNGNASENEILKFLAEHPAALQRPIVVRGDRAVVARPPDKLIKLIAQVKRDPMRSQSGNKPVSKPGPAAGENPPPPQFGRSKFD